jgi:TonB family protein
MIGSLLLLSGAAAQSAAPAESATCIRTTINAKGRTSNSDVVVSSGDRSQDRGALQFLKALDFSRMPTRVQLDQTGHVLVRATAPETFTLDATGKRLLAACPAQLADTR